MATGSCGAASIRKLIGARIVLTLQARRAQTFAVDLRGRSRNHGDGAQSKRAAWQPMLRAWSGSLLAEIP